MPNAVASKLEAVNTMLATIGEDPVNSIAGSQSADVAMALNTLNEVLREILSEKWRFNSDTAFSLVPDVEGVINLPQDALSVDINEPSTPNTDLTVRSRKVYDRAKSTFNIGRTIKAEVRWLLEFDEIPPAAAHYVTIRASRKFSDRTTSSGPVHQFSQRDEIEARTLLLQADYQEADLNFVAADPDTYRFTYNRVN